MELWFTEKQTPDLHFSCKTVRTLHVEQTDFQHMAVIETSRFGRMLVLDGAVQTTVADEFVYHEMITHIPLLTHPKPRHVLVIGGGDGGAIREILKHPSIERAELVEIDGRVIDACRQYLPEISCALDDPRVRVIVDDGIKHVHAHKNTYDVIMVDSTDPVGPAVGLFAREFYQGIFDALKPDGLFVAQSESPFFNQDLIRSMARSISGIFPITRLYIASIPTYPSGMWSFMMGSKQYDPLAVDMAGFPSLDTRYVTPELYKGCFALPRFAAELLK